MSDPTKDSFEFGNFKVDAVERVLLHSGRPVPLTQKVFDLLLLLVRNSGHVVEKENLMQNIPVLRKVLNDDGHQFIQTVPRRGYRFVGHVREVLEDTELVIEEH